MKNKGIAVECDKVTKKYYEGKRYQPTLREWVDTILTRSSFSQPTFKALDNVSFSIKRGQVVGFIGSNGAGKSTLLKLIMKITYPNEGKIAINGSVAGLLELGTGFHPNLTGKENVYLYASILGLKQSRIEKMYPKVVEFSGVKDFMETPLKHYSSGMLARLGFSVAIHIEPEILVIDEVLAVGDMSFQQKCMNYMINFCRDPKHTVVFVSHNIDNVRLICEEVVWLEHGKIVEKGPTEPIVKKYIKFQKERVD